MMDKNNDVTESRATEVNVIIIDVENEIGEKTPVEIDDTDDQNEAVAENGTLRRKVSISGRILRSRNSIEQVVQLHQEAENRKKQLEELLVEHAQIVHQVEVALESSDEETPEVDDVTRHLREDDKENAAGSSSHRSNSSSASSQRA